MAIASGSATFTVPASVAASDPVTCDTLEGMLVAIAGTFSATMTIQGSLDASTWYDFPSATGITAAGAYEIPGSWVYLRINVTGWVSGTPTAILQGHR